MKKVCVGSPKYYIFTMYKRKYIKYSSSPTFLVRIPSPFMALLWFYVAEHISMSSYIVELVNASCDH